MKRKVGPEGFAQILKRTNKKKPSQEDVAALRKALRENPNLWRGTGDLTRRVEAELISTISSVSVVTESLIHGVKEMRQEMGYTEVSLLERLLIDASDTGLAGLSPNPVRLRSSSS